MKKLILAFAALGLVAGSAPAMAAQQCRDSKGKFVNCPAKPQQCRDSKGKFVKCPAKPKQCRDSKGHFITCK